MRKGSNVRITDEAHGLLTEKAEHLGATMKEVASEAIFLLARGDERAKRFRAQEDRLKERIKGLQKTVRDSRRYAFGTFVLGAVVAGCLMFAVGVTL